MWFIVPQGLWSSGERRKTARYFSKLSETGPGDGTAKRRKIEETLEGADDGEDNAFEDAFR